MLRGFRTILIKELKELVRDPKILVGMIVVPLLMFPVLGLVLGYAVETAQEQAQQAIEYLRGTGIKVIVENNLTPQQIIDQGLLVKNNSSQFIEIPSQFSTNMTQHTNGNLEINAILNSYGVYQGGGVFSDIGSSVITSIVNSFNRIIAPNVLYMTQSTIIKGEIQQGIDPAALSGLLISQALALPVTIMIMLTYSMQIAATSVAMEKEEKTLETLLTMPVDRFAILMGKLSSTIIVAGIAAVTMMIGYNYMLGSVTIGLPTDSSIDLVKLGLVPSPFGYVLLGVSLFITLLSALALAVIISAFAEDVRGAQSLIGYIYPIIFIPSLALIYLDFNSLPLIIKTILYAIPYSHPVIASKVVIFGDYATVIFGIIYVTIFTVGIMYIASRFFATEKILTAKLRFNLKKKKEKLNK
jgi:ABC-2 type transport system permease protein